jgi:hypothetical protein
LPHCPEFAEVTGKSGLSPARAKKTAGLIEKKLWSLGVHQKANIEKRIINIECRRNVFYPFMWIDQGKPTVAGRFRFVQQILTF